MATQVVTVREAATALGITPRTVQKDVNRGCRGIVRPGKDGRGNGALLDLEEYRRWRAAQHGGSQVDVQRECERAFQLACSAALRTYQDGDNRTSRDKLVAAYTLCAFLNRLAPTLLGHQVDDMPVEMRTLVRVLQESSGKSTEN